MLMSGKTTLENILKCSVHGIIYSANDCVNSCTHIDNNFLLFISSIHLKIISVEKLQLSLLPPVRSQLEAEGRERHSSEA